MPTRARAWHPKCGTWHPAVAVDGETGGGIVGFVLDEVGMFGGGAVVVG
ncbi:MAG: hypothetical protein HUJ26_09430 [Planctomycetaceae bacterium]|nr:hypothetical protein [Planctomycetaceae bacterium]